MFKQNVELLKMIQILRLHLTFQENKKPPAQNMKNLKTIWSHCCPPLCAANGTWISVIRVYQREHYADHSYKAVISPVVMLLVSV